ncbi:hypothetical protein D3C85_310680 [compost metagenome]
MGVDVGLAAGAGRPVGGRAQVDGVVGGNGDVFEHHLVAARGAQAQVVPARDHADAGRVARHQEHAGARRGLVGARPDRQPRQALDAGRVELVAVDAPALGRAPRHGAGQAAARRRAQRGLHAQRVDERAVRHRVACHALAQVRGPAALAARERLVLQVGHGEDQRGGGLAARHRRDHAARRGQRGAAAAVCGGRDEADQAVRLQRLEVLARKGAAAVVVFGRGRELVRQAGQHGGIDGGRGVCVGNGRRAAQGECTHGARTVKARCQRAKDASRISKFVFLRSFSGPVSVRSRFSS